MHLRSNTLQPSQRRAIRGGFALAALIIACAPGVTIESSPAPVPSADSARTTGTVPVVAIPAWPVRVREHVDLWLHGFAMLQADSTLVPYFRRGYRAELSNRRSAGGLTTQLDANAATLRARLETNPALVSAQFVPLYFESWEELRRGAELFLRLEGDARGAGDRSGRETVATFATYFPARDDREWLRTFLASLEDERVKFYATYWREEQRTRGPIYDAAVAAWRSTFAARFERFLSNSRQRQGQILASLPLAGEGRTLSGQNRDATVAVGFPVDTVTIVYVFAHEILGTTVNDVVADNISPAERRTGALERYVSLAAVRGGAMLLSRIAPDLVSGYMRYYTEVSGASPGGDPERAFVARFPLPDAIRDALQRQIDNILGGI